MIQPSGEKFKNIIFNSIEIIWGYKHITVSLISSTKIISLLVYQILLGMIK